MKNEQKIKPPVFETDMVKVWEREIRQAQFAIKYLQKKVRKLKASRISAALVLILFVSHVSAVNLMPPALPAPVETGITTNTLVLTFTVCPQATGTLVAFGTNGVYYATNSLGMVEGDNGVAHWSMTCTNYGDVIYCYRFASTRGNDMSAWSQAVHAPTPPKVFYGFNLSCVSDIYEGPSLNDLTWFNGPLTNQYFASMNFGNSVIFRGASNQAVNLQPLFLQPL